MRARTRRGAERGFLTPCYSKTDRWDRISPPLDPDTSLCWAKFLKYAPNESSCRACLDQQIKSHVHWSMIGTQASFPSFHPDCLCYLSGRTGAAALQRMRTNFSWMSKFVKDGGRLKHIMDRGHTTKMHTYIQICGGMGAYAVWAAAHGENPLPMLQAVAIMKLLQAMGDLWTHSVHRWVCCFHSPKGETKVHKAAATARLMFLGLRKFADVREETLACTCD